MTPRTYASPEAFKQAPEQRLRSSAKTGAEFARKRQLLVFDRFLARIALVLGDAATLKGGLVLELRLDRARTTKDVDLRMVGSPEDVLGFAGIAPPTLRLYPLETHVAEKLHAYTMPRARPNSRVKDLPDLALLGSAQKLDARRLRAALEQTFAFRKTHPLPESVPAPAEAWRTPYEAMAREDQLHWPTLDQVTAAAKAFLDPVLAAELDATWQPAEWLWR